MAVDHIKAMRAALGRIKGLAKSKSADRLKARFAAKSAPPAPKAPENKVDEIEPDAIDVPEPKEEAEEAAAPEPKKEKTSELIFIGRGVKKAPDGVKTAPEMPPKRKRGRPPKMKG